MSLLESAAVPSFETPIPRVVLCQSLQAGELFGGSEGVTDRCQGAPFPALPDAVGTSHASMERT